MTPKEPIQTVADYFYADDFVSVLRSTVDTPRSQMKAEDFPFVVGALTFLGRLDEAQYLFDHYSHTCPLSDRVVARFFLAIAYCRHHDGDRSRALLIANARDRHKVDSVAKFYILQGLGFYRYTYGAIQKAHRLASRAHQAAFLVRFPYGRILALDLLAQIEIQLGSIRQGLRRYESIQTLADEHDFHGTKTWSAISYTLQKAQYGLLGHEAIASLRRLLSRDYRLDTYSQALLQLEIVNQQILAGRMKDAGDTLQKTQGSVFETDNPRLIAQLYQKLGAFHLARGDADEASRHVDLALQSMTQFQDRKLEQKIRGLNAKIRDERDNELMQLNKSHSFYLGRRIQARATGLSHTFLPGQDPLGDVLDDLAWNRNDPWATILNYGWFGLIYEILHVPREQETLVLDAHELGSLTLLSKGEVQHKPKSLTPLLRKLFKCLSEGEMSKEEILEKVWETSRYSPTRHNHLIYNLLGVARKLLGDYADWIASTDNGYTLKHAVVLDLNKPVFEVNSLNSRQLAALAKIRTSETFEAKEYQDWFHVSGATAARDIRSLLENKWIERTGAARSTVYRPTERTLTL